MLERNELFSLVKTLAKADPSVATAYSFGDQSYSYDVLNETARRELNEYLGSNALYRENKNMFFSLMEEVLTEVLPKKVLAQYGDFAEVKVFGQGDKPVFKRKLGRQRAKQFITNVGLAGVYEVFRLGEESFEVTTEAIGGAARIGIEEFLDGRVDFSELIAIVMEGLDERVYQKIADSLIAAIDQLPANNQVAEPSFDEAKFDKLLAVVSAYGIPTIYCTYEFAVTMMPADKWISEAMKDEKWANGYFTTYKGHRVIILPQSFVDEKNTEKVIDPGYCYIMPSGEGKPVKVAFEGATAVKEVDNEDWSKEFRVYKKLGVATIITNNIAIYRNTSLTKNM
jgi:hypothetical protein